MPPLFFVIAVGILITSVHVCCADDRFQEWLRLLNQRAVANGVSPEVANAALTDLTFKPEIIELERKQPEFTETLSSYLDRVVSPSRILDGRKKLVKHHDLLQQVGAEYGVQPRFIIALWAIESDFGRFQGRHPTVESLATLGFGGRRGSFFRSELLHLLHLIEREKLIPSELLGSWAGAMGQCQFMPSSFHKLAIDHDGDGKRDIWRNHADIFASIANFLAHVGWREDQTWGREVQLPHNIKADTGMATKRTLAEWQLLGVRRLSGKDLPQRNLQASLILPKRGDGRAFLVYKDFRILLKWNNSIYFALSVGKLADHLRSAG